MKAVIGKHFVGGYCSDDETKSAINKVYTENGYLMDTHTAVAYNKLAAYRKDTGCVTPAVVVSTASRISSATVFFRHWDRRVTLPEQSLSKSFRK